MMKISAHASLALPFAAAMIASAAPALAQTPLPQAIAAPDQTAVATFHAIGAQIYECKPGNDGKLAWTGREPIAALTLDGKTIGRHYAGPTWEHIDGSAVVARAVGNAPGKTPADVAWLRLEVTSSRGNGILTPVATVQRINTMGGAQSGPCDKAGALHSVAYEADYVFLRKK